MLAVRTPGAPQTARIARSLVPPSPLRDRVSYSDHDRFRGYFPVHFIPAYNLPVYASQRPLPDATQDSVRGCSLGFAAAVIADGRLQRACKAQPAQIRTGPIRAYGSHLGCLTAKRLSGHGWRIRGFGSQSSANRLIRSQVVQSLWLRCRSVRRQRLVTWNKNAVSVELFVGTAW